MKTILVTGGAGFIGANFVLDWIAHTDGTVITLDKLTYAGNVHNLDDVMANGRHTFVKGDIGDASLVSQLLARYRPEAIINFAAESHVDRSIAGPEAFVTNNIVGTFHLLEATRAHWMTLDTPARMAFRFLQVSTDEVYGSLGPRDPAFTEISPYAPNSPYAATKAAADHLVRSYTQTYGLPTLTTHCSNNYGPFQFPEKLIPLVILNAIQGKPLPLYGDGLNIRDWLYVEDHCTALRQVLATGRIGETYNIGGHCELTNRDVMHMICTIVDQCRPDPAIPHHATLITPVRDRPGHDRRYAIDAGKIDRELGWVPTTRFEIGIQKTVEWYLTHDDWVRDITSGEYRKWVETHYSVMA